MGKRISLGGDGIRRRHRTDWPLTCGRAKITTTRRGAEAWAGGCSGVGRTPHQRLQVPADARGILCIPSTQPLAKPRFLSKGRKKIPGRPEGERRQRKSGIADEAVSEQSCNRAHVLG